MKFNIINIEHKPHNFTILQMQPGLQNVKFPFPVKNVFAICSDKYKELLGINSEEKIQNFNNNIFVDDPDNPFFGVDCFNGCDYLNAEYVFGDEKDIQNFLNQFIEKIVTSVSTKEFLHNNEMPVFVFHAEENGKGIIFSNTDESEMESSLIAMKNKYAPSLLHFGGGHFYDDIGITDTACSLFSILPESKGIKLPDEEQYSNIEEHKEFWEDSDLNLVEKIESFSNVLGEDIAKNIKNSEFLLMIETINRIFFLNNPLFLEEAYFICSQAIDNLINKIKIIRNIENLPEEVRMTYVYGNSNKEYSLKLEGNIVHTTYGPIGKKLKSDELSFTNDKEAREHYHKSLIKQIKKGYDLA